MVDGPLVTLEEIRFRMSYQADQFQCVVEGKSDQRLVNRAFREARASHARAFEISQIELPPSLFGSAGPTSGNRSRVVKLAELIGSEVGAGTAPLACLVDRDLDCLMPCTPALPLLVITSGPSLDQIYHNEEVLDCVLDRFLRVTGVVSSHALEDVLTICNEMFLARAADRQLALYAGWLPPESDCRFEGQRLVIDDVSYHNRYCRRDGLQGEIDSYLAAVDTFRPETSAHGPYANGHDFVLVLRHLAVLAGADRNTVTVDNLWRALDACLGTEHLLAEPSIQELLARAFSTVS